MAQKRILIIDDDPMVTDFLAELIAKEGHHITIAETSDDAVKKAEYEEFHLIMLDINMPHIEGINLYLKLKEIKKDKTPPMIIISGSGIEPSLIQAIKKGADTFIKKPSEIGLIRERINQCLASLEEEVEQKNILVIDDEPMVRDFLAELLAKEGYRVVTAKDGYDALGRVRTERFHLIIVDIDMPRVEGTPIHTKLEELIRNKPVPVILMSGSGIEPPLIKTLKEDMHGFITKPLDVDVIREKVRKCLKIDNIEAIESK